MAENKSDLCMKEFSETSSPGRLSTETWQALPTLPIKAVETQKAYSQISLRKCILRGEAGMDIGLIDAGADINMPDKENKTALFYAVQQSNNESVFRALIDAGPDVNKTDNEGKTALFYAVQGNNESLVCALIDVGADVNITDNQGKTALFYAVQNNNESLVCALIDVGADVNITDNQGKTALFYAVQGNNESVVRALMEEGNSLTSPRDIYGRTPLFYAMMAKPHSIICYLLGKKINLRIKDNGGMNFLSFFIDYCISKPAPFLVDEPRMKHFISERIDVIVKGRVKKNTLCEAIINITFCKCPLLFYSGINIPILIVFLELAKTYSEENESEIDGVLKMVEKTVNAQMAECRNLVPQIVDLLCDLGADPNSADTEGNTALHYTTRLPFYGVSKEAIMDLLKKLEEAGVTVDKKNHQSESPLLFCLSLHCSNDQQLLHESNQLAAIKILVEVCGFLIKNGSNVEETTRIGDSVLHLIMRLLQQILKWHGITRLKDAVQIGIELFTLFSSTRAGRRVINKKDENLNLPLHLWASLEPPHECFTDGTDGRSVFSDFMKEIIKTLLECGTQLNERNKRGQTPLHLCRTWIAVELLIDSGADPKVVDSVGRSPLIAAAQNKTLVKSRDTFYPDVDLDPRDFWITSLDKGLDPWIVDEHGNSVLSALVESEAVDLAKAMIDVAYINGYLASDSISTSLLKAICKNSSSHSHWKSSLVETIINSAHLVNIKKGFPLDLCCRNIIEAAKTLSVDEVKKTVHWTIAKQLLLYGADYTTPDESGQSCLDIAEKFPALKKLLNNFAITDDTFPHPWVSVSQRYQPILAKVVRRQESRHVHSFWYYESPLGKGSFGLIFAGINENDGREVAIKRIEKLRMKRPEDKREIRTLAVLVNCDQVVQYLSFFEDEHFSFIVLELMEGNLDDYFDDPNNRVTDSLCQDLVKGLEYLHGLDILHRDLKPSNILYKKFPKLSLKIADFGLSHYVAGSTSTSAYASLAGTRCWMAPELLICSDAKSSVFSKASDMFSCGLILHYILSVKKHPFAPADHDDKGTLQVGNEIEANILNGRMEGWDDSLCPEANHLLKAMLDGDGSKRPSADKALDHPFFWSKKKKLDLLIAVGNQPEFECPRARRTLPLTAVETDLERSVGTIVKHLDWAKGNVLITDIYKEMRKKISYDTHSVVELVRFIRNAYAHVSESTRRTLIKKPLLEDFVFFEYFPSLVMEVYNAVTTHGWDQTKEEIKYVMKK